MTENAAYRSTDPQVLAAWETFKAATDATTEKRADIAEEFGRGLMVNRRGFGHGTRAVGFERLDDDKDGQILGDGALRVRVRDYVVVGPNLRRKAGKDLAARLAELDSPSIDLPGMPDLHFTGLSVSAPALWEHNGTMYALWADSGVEVGEQWESIPLSAYHAAHEAKDASGPTA